jgi:pyruvate dehydrogenase E1 component alpha subunit
MTEAELDAIEVQAAQDIKDAVDFAENSPEPRIENIFDDVYAV